MLRYRRLNLVEREEFSRLLAAGRSLRASARCLGRAPSSLSRELTRRWMSRATYRAVLGERRARWRARQQQPPPRHRHARQESHQRSPQAQRRDPRLMVSPPCKILQPAAPRAAFTFTSRSTHEPMISSGSMTQIRQ
jgi:IS30 family transposase